MPNKYILKVMYIKKPNWIVILDGGEVSRVCSAYLKDRLGDQKGGVNGSR
jgi:hypothetical protein